MGLAFALVVRLAVGIAHRQTRDRHRLASPRFSTLLEVEESAPRWVPAVCAEVRNLIRQMSLANPRWGAPRLHGELLKIEIEVSQTTVQIPGAAPQSSFTNLANVSQEPHQGLGVGRLLHGPYDCIQALVCLRHSRP